MTADVVKNVERAMPIAGHEQRQAHELDRVGRRPVRDRVRERNPCPGTPEDGIALVSEIRVTSIGDVRQTYRLIDWS
ncbi:MAG TPA: hypothetical protein VK793_18855 [Steroidobacteraceae bacterium]|nr:hypothetical protein [Steroidobacteraceae bacterium]